MLCHQWIDLPLIHSVHVQRQIGQKRIYSLYSIPVKQHTDAITTRSVKDPKTTATTRTGSPFTTGGDGRWQRSTPLSAAMSHYLRSTSGSRCTFFTHEQPLAADGAGVVEAVLHLTAVCPGTSPPDGQQEYRLFWRPVHHVVEAPAVVQQGLVEEPPVLWLRTCCCPAVEPQANHCIVLSNIIIITYAHRATDWDCWRHYG